MKKETTFYITEKSFTVYDRINKVSKETGHYCKKTFKKHVINKQTKPTKGRQLSMLDHWDTKYVEHGTKRMVKHQRDEFEYSFIEEPRGRSGTVDGSEVLPSRRSSYKSLDNLS